VRLILSLLLVGAVSCAAPAPQPKPTAPPAARPTPTLTPTPDPATTAISIVPLRISESPLPPASPTAPGFTAGRATPTPYATAEAAWKYVTITFAIENRSDAPRLVGLAGGDPTTSNLNSAFLTARDGTKYRAMSSTTSFGMRNATSHALTTYPVLLRLPPGFRAAGESAGTLSVVAPDPSAITFKVSSSLSDYGTLSIPPLANLGPKSGDDEVTRGMRPLIGGFQPLNLAGVPVGDQHVTFPIASPASPLPATGTPVSIPGKVTVTLVNVTASDPTDFEIRNRGWKLLSLGLQYRNDDTQQGHAFNVVGWLFGEDGVVYTGDAPSIGDFGGSLTPPPPSAILIWDGRFAGSDLTAASRSLEPRQTTFLVPRDLHSGVLVLAGDVEMMFNVTGIPTPPSQ
jgi:hypothetical protein